LPVPVDRAQGIKHAFDFACTVLPVTAALTHQKCA